MVFMMTHVQHGDMSLQKNVNIDTKATHFLNFYLLLINLG